MESPDISLLDANSAEFGISKKVLDIIPASDMFPEDVMKQAFEYAKAKSKADKQAALEANAKEFGIDPKQDEDTGKFVITKVKKSQAVNSVTNSYAIENRIDKIRFNISISATAMKTEKGAILDASDASDELDLLQRLFVKFLGTVKSELETAE